ncbi:MAG: M20/M25/M40 family metallo-hydrolase [Alphaproteobacteria bacterium]|nr:M20/M25/M40 family metallo-hydrolase [Alphaproteobacteria bacterium]
MDEGRLEQFVETMWNEEIIPTLVEYIRIPNKSPAFDPDWAKHGHMKSAVALFESWAKEKLAAAKGASVEVIESEGRTPLIFIDIPGATDDTAVLYGHLDKQPEFSGWNEGLGPWEPALRGDKLYGRGGADDGYAMFAAITAVLALDEQNAPRPRCAIMIEACEESGSADLPYYVDRLGGRLGEPALLICLDSGAGDYDRLWLTTSLRGIAAGDLTVRVLEEGVHSGDASGVVPSSFRIAKQLIARIEDPATGKITRKEFSGDIPKERVKQAKRAAKALGENVYARFPFVPGAGPVDNDLKELILNRTWRAQLSVVGFDGLPPPPSAGNVMAPFTTLRLSMRIPPGIDSEKATAALGAILTAKPPYGAQVTFEPTPGMTGWNAPETAPWLQKSIKAASMAAFGAEPAFMGEGGSIPFVGMLGEKFPKTQFVVTGVLGPHSNAHGPNEFLHIPMGKKVTAAVARILRDCAARGADRA